MRRVTCRLQAKEVLHKAHQLASALLWAHTAGVVHQDLHTQNVLNSRDGHSWLLADFGQACSTTQEDNPSKATVLSRIGYNSFAALPCYAIVRLQ